MPTFTDAQEQDEIDGCELPQKFGDDLFGRHFVPVRRSTRESEAITVADDDSGDTACATKLLGLGLECAIERIPILYLGHVVGGKAAEL